MITKTTVETGTTISKTHSRDNTAVIAVENTGFRTILTIEAKGTTFNISSKQRIF